MRACESLREPMVTGTRVPYRTVFYYLLHARREQAANNNNKHQAGAFHHNIISHSRHFEKFNQSALVYHSSFT